MLIYRADLDHDRVYGKLPPIIVQGIGASAAGSIWVMNGYHRHLPAARRGPLKASTCRPGAAGNMMAVARTIGWSLASALVVVIFAIARAAPTILCLQVAAGFSAFTALISSARRFNR
jgi:hypothetical protein